MRHIDLFSGAVAGFSFAASHVWPEIEHVAFCEIDPWRRKQLNRIWPGVPVIEDVNDEEQIAAYASGKQDHERDCGIVGETTRGRQSSNSTACACHKLDLLTASPPCQPSSCAGLRLGEADPRWLWPQTLKAVEITKPRWLCFENPTGFLSIDGGMAYENVVSSLEGKGYWVESFIIPASAVGAWHRRNRVWIIANLDEGGCGERRQSGRMDRIQNEGKNGAVQAEEPDPFCPYCKGPVSWDGDFWRCNKCEWHGESEDLIAHDEVSDDRGRYGEPRSGQEPEPGKRACADSMRSGRNARSDAEPGQESRATLACDTGRETAASNTPETRQGEGKSGESGPVRDGARRQEFERRDRTTSDDHEARSENRCRMQPGIHRPEENQQEEQIVGNMRGLSEQPWDMHWLQAVEQFCSVVPGLPADDPDRARWIAAMGDSVVPQVIVKIMQAIRRADT